MGSFNNNTGKKSRRKILRKPMSIIQYRKYESINPKGLELILVNIECRRCGAKGKVFVDPYGNVYTLKYGFTYDASKKLLRKLYDSKATDNPINIRNYWVCDLCKTEIDFVRKLYKPKT